MTLSLPLTLYDPFSLQLARIENYTVGSMMVMIKVEGLLASFEGVITSDNPIEHFKRFVMALLNKGPTIGG